MRGGGYGRSTRHIQWSQLEFDTSQLNLTAEYKVFNKTCNYFVTGEDDKAVFSIPGDTVIISEINRKYTDYHRKTQGR